MRITQIFSFLLLFSLIFVRNSPGNCQTPESNSDVTTSAEALNDARQLMHRNKNDEALQVLQKHGKSQENIYKKEQEDIIKAISDKIAIERKQVETGIISKEKQVNELKEGNQDIDVQNKILTANTILFFSILLTAVVLILLSRFRVMAKSKVQLAHSNALVNQLNQEVAALPALLEKAQSELTYFESAAVELKKADHTLESFLNDKNHPVHKPAKNLVDTASTIQTVLRNSKIDLNEEEKVESNLNELIEEMLNQVYYFRKARNSEFDCAVVKDLEKILPKVEVFPAQIRFVLFNLLENAMASVEKKVENAPKGYQPTVSISTRKLPRFVQIRIKDNGSGIDDKAQAQVFKPFYSTRNSTRHPGLGLTESQHFIVTAHKGELFIESDLSNSTDFIIRFPTLTIM